MRPNVFSRAPIERLPLATRVNARIACAATEDAALTQEPDETVRPSASPACFDEAPPFDPPDADDILGPAFEDDDAAPPFDPPDLDDQRFSLGPAPPFDQLERADDDVLPGAANENASQLHSACRVSPRVEAAATCRPLPAISIYASWDRPEIAGLIADFADDALVKRAHMGAGRGGIDGATAYFAAQPPPDLLILDTTLRGEAMLAALDRLLATLGTDTKVIVLGAINDIGLLRELASRGVSEYVMPPLRSEDLVRSACRLFADVDKSRVIAVIGARGGVGASTIAHNLAWSIAERQDSGVTLLDLDLSFGAAAVGAELPSQHLVTDLLVKPEQLETAAPSDGRLQLFTAPAVLEPEAALNPETLTRLIAAARRTNPFVVLDLPHAWNAWVRQALLTADDIVLVAGPDLASLRNVDGIVKHLRTDRPDGAIPFIALSMQGVPRRPEIPAKDFSDAVGVKPVAFFAFDPELFGAAAIANQMIGEAAPGSKAAVALDKFATLITGRATVERRTPRKASATEGAPVLELTRVAQMEPSEPDAAPATPPAPLAPFAPFTFRAESWTEAPAPAAVEVKPITLESGSSISATEVDQLAAARLLQADLRAMHHPPRGARRKEPSVLLRAAAVATLIVAVAALYSSDRREAANATAPRVARAAVTPAPVVDRDAQFRAALALLGSPETRHGLNALRRLAEDGFAPAQYRLAKLYETGQGVEANADEALRWTERAAANGHARAMHDLGVYAARGDGSARDDAAAFRWFRQAADFDVADSQYNLGILYLNGRSVSADPSEALFWFLLAARHGDGDAAERARDLETQLTPMQVENAHARAQAFEPRAPVAAE